MPTSPGQYTSPGSIPEGPPPAYDASAAATNTYTTQQSSGVETAAQADDPFSFLATFDTIFLIDDSGSMAGGRWRECEQAVTSITPICLAHDEDGIDIYFLNHPDSSEFKGIKTANDVRAIFQSVRPKSSTPTGTKLHKILTPYLKKLKDESLKESFDGTFTTKPLNIIVITDGSPTDELDAVIILAADKLDACGAPPWQVGIQFFQIGNDVSATEALRELDDNLGGRGESGGKKVRDIVDTVPWTSETTGRTGLNADGMLKVVLGAVNRRLDKKKNDESWRSMAAPSSGSRLRR